MNAQSQGRKKLSSQDARNLRTLLLLNVFEAEVIGERIARARTEAGLTQEELAELIGVSTRSLQGYEAGAVKPYRHMAKLSSTLNRPVAWFLHGEEEDTRLSETQSLRERVEGLADQLDRIERLLRGRAGPSSTRRAS
jgi:HTH-type transcriptional regulator, cell division transcriptional repressor